MAAPCWRAFARGLVTTRLPRAVRSRRSQISTVNGTSPLEACHWRSPGNPIRFFTWPRRSSSWRTEEHTADHVIASRARGLPESHAARHLPYQIDLTLDIGHRPTGEDDVRCGINQ